MEALDPTPEAIREYLYRFLTSNRALAYIVVTKSGDLHSVMGDWAHYGIGAVNSIDDLTTELYFLMGFLPLDGPSVLLPAVKLDNGVAADVHIFSHNDYDWVVLLDVTVEEQRQQAIQQKVNDLSLLRERQFRLLEKSLDENLNQLPVANFPTMGERREVAILFADIRNFTSYSEQKHPEAVVKILNRYLRAMIPPILDEAGIVDKIIGDAVMAIFGVLPAANLPSVQAFQAARRMLLAVQELGQQWEQEYQAQFSVGIGVATGSVSLGILGGTERRFFGAIGRPVNLAARLESKAQANEILIDEHTWQQLGVWQAHFQPRTLTLDDFGTLSVYAWEQADDRTTP
jgi:class 3 adenylate cyclase